MKNKIIQELTGKKILILGFGREGKSTYNFLKKNNVCCNIGIADLNEIQDEEVLKDNILLHTGKDYLKAMDNYDIIIKTPGISFKDVDINPIKEKLTSQTELFIKYAKEKVIGITGTKGKSTTASLIYDILKKRYKTRLVGNIGLPAFEEIDEYDSTDYFVYELSSHQLEFVRHSPKYAILLNMFEEHLDHYKDYEAYKEAKRNIYKYQNKDDYYIFNIDEQEEINGNRIFCQHMIGITSRKIKKENTCSYNESEITIKICGSKNIMNIPSNNFKGKHNIYNMTVAMTISKLLKVEDDMVISAISEFKTLPHRLEVIGNFNGVTYIDDSIATIPEAVISAVDSIKGVDTVLIGGLDRGINYEKLIKYILLNKISNVILMYDSGKKIYNKVINENHTCNIIYEETLEEAVKSAVKITEKGKICLLSPAAASYGVFKNFEERGDKFKEFVIKYT